MTKIDIISGFLGAGKTTLIKKLIKESLGREQIVIIENEFGEIGIDGGFLKDAGITVNEMNSGCICCSLSGDFSKALEKVINEYSPDRIIIEPSGVGKLSDVISAVNTVISDSVSLNSFSTVADAGRFKIYHKNFGEFFDNQIESARTVILSHTKGISDEKIQFCIDMIRKLNPKALVSTTDWDEITGDMLLQAIESGNSDFTKALLNEHEHDEHFGCHEHHHDHDEHCDCHEHHHEHDEHCTCGCHEHHHDHAHHHADDIFTSWGKQTSHKYSCDELKEMLASLESSNIYGSILRAKGIVQTNNGQWLHFDYVPGEPDIRTGGADVTGRICVIGAKINEQELERLFK